MAIISICEENHHLIDNGAYHALVSFDDGTSYPIVLSDPFTDKEEKLLEWYFEQHHRFPFIEEVKFKQAVAKIFEYGENLFKQVFPEDSEVRRVYQAALSEEKLVIEILGSPEFHHFHWEAMKDPNRVEPLALSYTITRKVLSAQSSDPIAINNSSPTINVLLLVARPKGQSDVGYRTISRPLVETIQSSHLPVKIDIVRPGTYQALREHLAKTTDEQGRGYYHFVHLDVHGSLLSYTDLRTIRMDKYVKLSAEKDLPRYSGYKAFILFSSSQIERAEPIEANQLANLLRQHEIPIAILNACQSAKQLNQATETSLASRLQQAGVQTVLAMAYSVTVSAATKFMETLYQQLFAGTPLPTAVCLARRTLHTDKARRADYNQQINLEDWLLPVLYQQQEVKLDFTQDSAISPVTDKYQEPLTTCGSFVGRDLDVLNIENRLLLQRNVLLIQGMAGAGKTTLLHHLGAWWQTTHLVERVFYFGYDTRAWNHQDIFNDIARQLWDDFYYQRHFQSLLEDEQQREVVSRLRQQRHLLILDNLESLTGIEQQFTLSPEKQQALHYFLQALVGGNTLVILGSRGEESWLATGIFENNVHHLAGLDEEAASQLVEKILLNCQATHYREDVEQSEALQNLQKRLAGYPLALQVVLSNLAKKTPLEVLIALEKGEEEIDLGKGTGDKTKSLLQCIDYSYRQLSVDAQKLLLCLAPFMGVIFEPFLEDYTNKLKQQPTLVVLPFEQWETVLQEAKNWGLLTTHPDRSGFLQIHPILPYFLGQRWQALPDYLPAIETAFRQDYDVIGGAIRQLLNSKQSEEKILGQVMAQLEQENLLKALTLSVAVRGSFVNIYEALSAYLGDVLHNYSYALELGEWILQNYSSTKMKKLQRGEYLTLLNDLALQHLYLRHYRQAQDYYQQILDIQIESNDRYFQARTYHNLGAIAQEQRQWLQAQACYTQALDIFIEFKDRSSQASTYHNLGYVAQEQEDWSQAKDYYQKALAIKIELKDRFSQARTYAQLGIVAQVQWQWPQAQYYYQQASEIFVEFKNRYEQARTYHQLGIVAQAQGQWPQAQDYLQLALGIKIELHDRYSQARTYQQLGSLAQDQEHQQQAKEYFFKALQLWNEFGDTYNIETFSLARLYLLYQQTQDDSVLVGVSEVMGVSVEEVRGWFAV